MYIDLMAISYHVSAPWPPPCTHNGAVTYIHVHVCICNHSHVHMQAHCAVGTSYTLYSLYHIIFHKCIKTHRDGADIPIVHIQEPSKLANTHVLSLSVHLHVCMYIVTVLFKCFSVPS